MLKTIMDGIMVLCLAAMMIAILFYYQSTVGKAIVCISTVIAVIAYFISDYLEDKEDKEEKDEEES